MEPDANQPSLPGKILAFVAAAVLLAVSLMFSLLLFAVARTHRRHGLGTQMLRWLEKVALAAGLRRIGPVRPCGSRCFAVHPCLGGESELLAGFGSRCWLPRLASLSNSGRTSDFLVSTSKPISPWCQPSKILARRPIAVSDWPLGDEVTG